jgi:hypothetical protein
MQMISTKTYLFDSNLGHLFANTNKQDVKVFTTYTEPHLDELEGMYEKYGVKVMGEAHSSCTTRRRPNKGSIANISQVATSRYGLQSYVKPRKKEISQLPLPNESPSTPYRSFKSMLSNAQLPAVEKSDRELKQLSILSERLGLHKAYKEKKPQPMTTEEGNETKHGGGKKSK